MPAGLEAIAEFAPRLAFEQDETPGRELAVIGRTDCYFENLAELIGTRPWRSHGFGRC